MRWPQFKSPVRAWRLEHKHGTSVRTQHLENPGPCGPPPDPGQHLAPGLSRGSPQSNKCHRKDGGETLGCAPLRDRSRVQVRSGAPRFAPAPGRPRKRHSGSAGPLGARGHPPAQGAPLQSQRPAPSRVRLSACQLPRGPLPTRCLAAHPGSPALGAARTFPGEFTGPLNLNPAGRPQDRVGGRGTHLLPPRLPRDPEVQVRPNSGSPRPYLGVYSRPCQC